MAFKYIIWTFVIFKLLKRPTKGKVSERLQFSKVGSWIDVFDTYKQSGL